MTKTGSRIGTKEHASCLRTERGQSVFFDPRTRENMLLTTPVLAECEIIDARFRGIQRELAEPMARDDSHIVLTSYMTSNKLYDSIIAHGGGNEIIICRTGSL